MYIVLTALLALNVSAEILNAFMAMDDSISESSALVGRSNERILGAIQAQAEAYEQFTPWREKAEAVQEISAAFEQYVAVIRDELITASGGLDDQQLPVGIKDKDTPTRLLIDEGRGDRLEAEIERVRAALLAIIDDPAERERLAASIPLEVKALPADTDKKSWAQFYFHQMPVAAVLPLLTKLQNDVKVAETSLLNYFFAKTDAETIKPDAFEAVVAADKSYVIRGEALTAEIFLGSYSSTADNIAISIDGRDYPVRNGKAVFTARPDRIGPHDFMANIKVTNPITGEEKVYQKRFAYEVGERSVTVSAEKMNVLYVGVENPIAVSAAGVASREVSVSAQGADLTKTANGRYIAKPTRPGRATITVAGGGLEPTTFEYRVKRIPTPIAKLGQKIEGSMSPGEFKVYEQIIPVLEGFDFNARCTIAGFELTRVPRGGDANTVQNRGGRYGEAVKRVVNQARRGDTYYFENIRAKCPGDDVTRKLNGMMFRIR